jgi:tetratricopeptide (TPR) repeat protein
MTPACQSALWLIMLALTFCPGTAIFSQTAESAESHVGKGYEALKQDRYAAAAEEFRAALKLDPSLVLRAQFPLGVSLFEEHKSAEARREFEAVRKQTGDHPNVLYYLGRLDVDELNYAGAIKNLKIAVAKPPFPDTAYYLGFAYFKQGDLPNAEKWLKQAQESNPRDSRVPYQLGFVYRKEGREEEAKKSLALSASMHHQDDSEAQLRTECGEKLEKGPRDEARAVCNKLYHDDDADRLTSLGMIYAKHGDLESALKPFVRAAELSPQSPQVQYNLALTYFQMNRFADARSPLEQALKRWPDLFPLNSLYGATLLKMNADDQAYDVLRHTNELNPQDMPTSDSLYFLSLNLAEKSQAAHQDSNAIIYLSQAARLRPREVEPHKKMAALYKNLGKETQAAAEQTEADRLGK